MIQDLSTPSVEARLGPHTNAVHGEGEPPGGLFAMRTSLSQKNYESPQFQTTVICVAEESAKYLNRLGWGQPSPRPT